MNGLPKGWRESGTGSLACPHRDVTVCAECAKRPEVVEVYAQHFWMPDAMDRAAIKAMQTQRAA